MWSVSYTHLDVYKRQPLFTIQLMGLVDKLKSRASTKALRQAIHQELESLEEGVIYWEE